MAENKSAKTPADDGQPLAWRIKYIKQVVLHAQGGSGGTGYIDGVWHQPEQQKPPLTDEQIEELLPEADGTAEEVKRKVEYRPGLWADEVGIDDAWSKPLVIEIIRAVEKHHGIGGKA